MDLNPQDVDGVARTILGEAGQDGPTAMAAVAHVIKNRVESDGYPSTYADVILQPSQFEPWGREDASQKMMSYRDGDPTFERAKAIASGVLAGKVPDPTNGATHFANDAIVRQRGNDSAMQWIQQMVRNGSSVRIGRQVFGNPNGSKAKAPSADDFELVGEAPAKSAAKAPAADDFELVEPGKIETAAKPAEAPAPITVTPSPPGPAVDPATDNAGQRPEMATGMAALAKARGEELQAADDKALVGEGFANPAMTAALNAGNTFGLNIPRNLGAGISTILGKWGVPGYEQAGSRSFSENYDLAKRQEEALSRQNPGNAWAGMGAGIAGQMALGGPVGLLKNVGMAAGLSGVGEFLDSKDLAHAGVSAGIGGTFGLVAHPVAALLGKATGAVLGRFASKEAPVAIADASGNLTPKAIEVLRGAGVDPAAITPEFIAGLQDTVATKGMSEAAAREALAAKHGITLTKGQATADFDAQRWEQAAAKASYGPEAQREVGGFFDNQFAQIQRAKEAVGEKLAGGNIVESPIEAGQMVADKAAAHLSRMNQAINTAGDAADAMVAPLRGTDPVDAGATVASAVRGKAAAAKADYRGKYREAFNRDGEIAPGALDDLPRSIKQALEERGDDAVFIHPTDTPAAQRALDQLEHLPNLGRRANPSRESAPVDGKAAEPLTPVNASIEGEAAAAPATGSEVFTPSGRKVGVEYRVVDAADPIASHGPDMAPNPAFPAELQPRDRSRAASEVWVNRTAGELQPQRLGASASAVEGAPILGPDGLVESGNGRVMAIRKAYQDGGEKAAAYRDWLASQGYKTDGIKNPMLVRVRTTDLAPEERLAFTREANADPTLSKGAAEVAATDAERLPASTVSLYQGGDVNSAANRPFVRSFVQNVAQKGEEGSIAAADGSLSLAGAQRVRNALLHAAYEDSGLVAKLAETGDEHARAFGNVLQDVAGDVAKLRQGIAGGHIDPAADVSKPMLEAARVVEKARSSGQKLADVVNQSDAFSPISDEAQSVLRAVYGGDLSGRLNRARAADQLRGAIEEASQQTAGPRLFGEPSTAGDILASRAKAPTADAAPSIADAGTMSAAEYRALMAGGDAPRVSAPSEGAAAAPAAPSASVLAPAHGPDLRGIDNTRKRLISIAGTAANDTDRRAAQAVIKEFDARVERTIEDGLFSGDPGTLDAIKAARGAFANYQRTFKAQGKGDDVGRTMQAIVERDATPAEVGNYLYGSGKIDGGRAVRLADRIKSTLGEGSPEWQAVQKGLVAKILGDGDQAKVSARISEAFTGSGRELIAKVLSPEHVTALRTFQKAAELSKKAGEAIPSWVSDLAKNGFNPADVVSNLAGATGFGKAGSPEYARGLRGFLGKDSPEWQGLRQATWQKLTAKPEGVDDFGTQAIGNRIGEFLNGKGSSLAREMFTQAERAQMAEFGELMKTLTPKRGAAPNSDTTAGLGARITEMMGSKGHLLLPLLGVATHGPLGFLTGAGIGKALNHLIDRHQTKALARKAADAVSGAPALPKPKPDPVRINSAPIAASLADLAN